MMEVLDCSIGEKSNSKECSRGWQKKRKKQRTIPCVLTFQPDSFCKLSQTQLENTMFAALGDCDKPLNATAARAQIPLMSNMLSGISSKCQSNLSNESFVKLSQCTQKVIMYAGERHRTVSLVKNENED
jgi:hypothetical protein